MADPIGTLGTAVGVASLGIQVCQGLLSYYSAYKGQDSKINAICVRIEGLTNILTPLRNALANTGPDHTSATAQVEQISNECADNITKLQAMLQKFPLITSTIGTKAKIRRVLFPFRIDTLEELENIISKLQNNLDSAVNVLQLGMTSGISRQSSTILNTINTTNSEIGKLSQGFSVIDQNLNQIPQLVEIAVRAAFDNHIQGRICPSDSLEMQLSSLQTKLLRSPSLLKLVCDQQAQPSNSLLEWPSGFGDLSIQKKMKGKKSFKVCSCPTTNSTQNRQFEIRSLRLQKTSKNTFFHQESCPFYISSRNNIRLDATYAIYGRFLSRIVTFSMSITTGAGGFSLSPTLGARVMVPITSPAFVLLDQQQPRLLDQGHENYPSFQQTLQKLAQLFKERKAHPTDVDEYGQNLLHHAFICGCMLDFKQPEVVQDYKNFLLALHGYNIPLNEPDIFGRYPIEFLVDSRVLSSSPLQQAAILTSELFSIGAEFSEDRILRTYERDNKSIPTREITLGLRGFLKAEEFLDALQFGPLCKAVLRKSEAQTKKILLRNPECSKESNIFGQTPLHLSADWPPGLRILLQSGFQEVVNTTDNSGFLPVSYASFHQCLESVQLLLEAGSSLHTTAISFNPDARDVLLDALQTHNSADITICLFQHLVNTRKGLQLLADQLELGQGNTSSAQSSSLLDARAQDIYQQLTRHHISIPESLKLSPTDNTIYEIFFHESQLGSAVPRPLPIVLDWAQKFYDAGFHDIDDYNKASQTLLMRRCHTHWNWETSSSSSSTILRFSIFAWLIEKGAKLDKFDSRQHPETVSHAPASHYLGEYLIRQIDPWRLYVFVPEDYPRLETILNLITQVITEPSSDNCSCACSSNGCVAVTQLLKGLRDRQEELWQPASRRDVSTYYQSPDKGRLVFFRSLANKLPIATNAWSNLSQAIIRFETFTRLELTHTCCTFIESEHYCLSRSCSEANYFEKFSEEDRIEIQDEESELIAKLEQLVTEFIAKFDELGVSLQDFLEGHWSARMDEVMRRRPLDLEERRKIREVGVVLHGDGEVLEESANNGGGGKEFHSRRVKHVQMRF